MYVLHVAYGAATDAHTHKLCVFFNFCSLYVPTGGIAGLGHKSWDGFVFIAGVIKNIIPPTVSHSGNSSVSLGSSSKHSCRALNQGLFCVVLLPAPPKGPPSSLRCFNLTSAFGGLFVCSDIFKGLKRSRLPQRFHDKSSRCSFSNVNLICRREIFICRWSLVACEVATEETLDKLEITQRQVSARGSGFLIPPK